MRKKLSLFVLLIISAFILFSYAFGTFEQKAVKIGRVDTEECLAGYVETGEDYEFTIIGFETHEVGGRELELCCSVIKTANGSAKYCHDLVRSELNPLKGYANFVIYRIEDGRALKSIEGYEKDGEFFWKSYEEGKESTIVYYNSDGRICARFLSENGTVEGDTCTQASPKY